MGPYPKVIIWAILGVFPTMGLLMIIFAFYVAYLCIAVDGSAISCVILLFICMIGIGLILLCIGWQFITVGMARYRFTKEGIYSKYPLRQEQLHPWEDFQQVCVCYAAYTTRGQRKANTIICCVKHGERKNFYDRWKADNPFRYRSIISIDYSSALHCGIKEMCPYEVIDLRNTLSYRL